MPRPGCCWWHLILTARRAWLPGDRRGFRSRDHRLHSSGDYKAPPPVDEHSGLRDYHRQHDGDERRFSPDTRRRIGEAIHAKLGKLRLRHLVIAVGPTHAHALAEYEDDYDEVKRLAGRLKQASSHAVRDVLPGRIWADGGVPIRVRDRAHQVSVFGYILRHAVKEGAWTWRFDCGERD